MLINGTEPWGTAQEEVYKEERLFSHFDMEEVR